MSLPGPKADGDIFEPEEYNTIRDRIQELPGADPNVGVAVKTAAATLTIREELILMNAAGGAFALTLPTAVGIPGRHYALLKTDTSTNAVTLGTTGGQTINGAATLTFRGRGSSAEVYSDGANWVAFAGIGGIINPLEAVLANYTKASLPAASLNGRLARVTDDLRGVWMDNGSVWSPLYPVINASEAGGSDMGARIQAAIDSLPATGGTVDARGFTGAQSSAGNITLGSSTKPVVLLLGAVTLTMTSPSKILYHNNSQIIGAGHATLIQGNHTSAIIDQASAGTKTNVVIRGIFVDNTTKTNVGGIGIQFKDAQWGVIEDVRIENVELGIKLHPGTASTLYNRILSPRIRFVTTGIEIGDSGGGAANANQVIGGQTSDATNGVINRAQSNKVIAHAVEVFTGVGVDVTATALDALVLGCHFENTAAGTSIGVRINATALRTTLVGNVYVTLNNSVSNSAPSSQLRNLDHQPGVGSLQAEFLALTLSTGAASARFAAPNAGMIQPQNSDGTQGAPFEFVEIADPAAGPSNTGRVYARDNDGKTQIVARFPTGAIQSIATQWDPIYPVVNAAEFAGSDMGVKVQAAIDALPATGGIVDARGFNGSQSSAGNITLGSDTKPIMLLLGHVTLTLASPSQIKYFTNSQIIGVGHASRIQGNHTTAIVTDGANATHTNVVIRGVYVDNTSSANAGGIGIQWKNVHWGSLENVRVENVETGIKLHPGVSSTLYNTILGARIRSVVTGIEAGDSGGGAANANQIIGGQVSNSTTGVLVRAQSTKIFGLAVEVFTGVGVDCTATAADTLVSGAHFENTSAGTSIGVRTNAATLRTTLIGNLYSIVNTSVSNGAPNSQLRNLDHQPGVGSLQAEFVALTLSTGAASARLAAPNAGMIQPQNSDGTAGTGFELVEIADPAAGASNTGRLYVRDNGSGKSQLVIRFNTGAIQVIATEP